ncbi:MAG TPA: hypothetical protein PKE19_00575 [Aestuariivirga sp.]|nr:hypothetical protein [Aestuariivirga sp.]
MGNKGKLTAILYPLIGTTLAGILFTVGLATPSLANNKTMLIGLAAAGFLVSLPLSWWVAGKIAALTNNR